MSILSRFKPEPILDEMTDTLPNGKARIHSRRVTQPSRTGLQKAQRANADLPLVERFKHLIGPDIIKPQDMIAHGVSRMGKNATITTCPRCKRPNKVVGPLSAKPKRRHCLPDCKTQRGKHPVTDKVIARKG